MDWSQGATEILPWKPSTPKTMLKFFILVEPHSCKEHISSEKYGRCTPPFTLAKNQQNKNHNT